jgi:energy-converting hydrogenase Eha subunit E
MAEGKLLAGNNFIAKTWDGTILMSTIPSRSYKMALYTGASNAADLTQTVIGNLTNEVAAQNGYVAGGFAITGLTVTSPAAGQFLLKATNLQIQATGGSLVFRHVVIYDNTTGIICYTSASNLISGVATDLTITANNYFVADLTTNGMMLYRANNA